MTGSDRVSSNPIVLDWNGLMEVQQLASRTKSATANGKGKNLQETMFLLSTINFGWFHVLPVNVQSIPGKSREF